MILDNSKANLKVHNWMDSHSAIGNMDIVTGYFTVGALAYLARINKGKVDKYRMVLGDIVNFDTKTEALDLLNENLSIDHICQLNRLAREAVEFLKSEKVAVKTLEPNFCHAKLYLLTAENNERNHYFISGSSNLTEAGLGLKSTSNVELNITEFGKNLQFKELLIWFDDLWAKPQAHDQKTVMDENGKTSLMDFKDYLIHQIARLFAPYTPEQIYFKILFELFHKDTDNAEVRKQLIKLEETKIYNKLYDFQKGGVHSLIRMLNKYNGAILADAVGLGKTWSALAVMHSFQTKGYDVIVLCPKKLEQNWKQYGYRMNSIFSADALDFTVRFHTDLRDGGLSSSDIDASYFTRDKPKLWVIDESHNLRNDKSSRYKYLVEQVLQQSKGDVKVLLLSATPINNSFKDIRNQFKLITKGSETGFKELLDINNLEYTFRGVQREFNTWAKKPGASLADFHGSIKDSDFFRLTDHLLVARTRKSIRAHFDKDLVFPKHRKPINLFKTPLKFGDFENFAELIDQLDLNLSAYLPATYTISQIDRAEKAKAKLDKKSKKEGVVKENILKDESQREHFLVKMMMVLLFKRLESSWASFQTTVTNIHAHHQGALDKITAFEQSAQQATFENIIDPDTQEAISDDDGTGVSDQFLLGKKNAISLQDIADSGSLAEFKAAIKKDKKTLEHILRNVKEFENKFRTEKGLQSVDTKLAELLAIIQQKQTGGNKKIVIFSAYTCTVQYLFDQLKLRGFTNFAMVSGNGACVWNQNSVNKNHHTVLERFAPFTKLYKEKKWADFEGADYTEWTNYIAEHQPDTHKLLSQPIDILIATDVLSEGQNLQDADMVINYDIHWNPVRVIQRVGRIDRIGSPNSEIQSINFWPAKDIDDYINLKTRVEKRMAIMKVSGSEVIDSFTDEFNEIAEASILEDSQNANMLRQMAQTMEEVDGEQTLGFDDFSFDIYRQLLQTILNQKQDEYKNMPKGVFSGIKIAGDPTMKAGMIALLGYPAQKKYQADGAYLSYELIYIDEQGNQLSNNQKVILEQLNTHYQQDRYVDAAIEQGDPARIKQLSDALRKWINNQAKTTIEMEDGSVQEVMSNAGLAMIHQLKSNPQKVHKQLKTEGNVSDKYQYDNFDLITWLVVS